MIAGADGRAPQGDRDGAASDEGRRQANSQICSDVAETRKRRRSRGSRSANPEAVSVAMPHSQIWVAYTAPGSRSQTHLTVLTTDRRQRPD